MRHGQYPFPQKQVARLLQAIGGQGDRAQTKKKKEERTEGIACNSCKTAAITRMNGRKMIMNCDERGRAGLNERLARGR